MLRLVASSWLQAALGQQAAAAEDGAEHEAEVVREVVGLDLSREPLGWDSRTLADILAWLERLPGSAAEALRAGFAEWGISYRHGLGVLVVAFLVGLLHYFWHQSVERWVEVREERHREALGDRRARTYAAVLTVALSCLLPLLLWGLCEGVSWYLAGGNPALNLMGILARLYLVSVLILLGFKEALDRRVLYLRSKEVSWLATLLWVLVAWVVIARVLISLAQLLGARLDVLAFLEFVYHAGIVLGVGVVLLNRRMVLANLPTVRNPLYTRFLKLFHKFYYFAVLFSLALAAFWLIGYVGIARALLLRSWAVVGVFVGLLYADQVFGRMVRRIVRREPGEGEEEEEEDREAEDLAYSTILIFRYLAVVAGVVIVLDLADLLVPAVDWLATPIFRMGEVGFSVWLLLQMVGVLLGFLLLSRFIEELLEYRVYPRLDVEVGIGKAISTAVKIVLLFVGVVIALEAAGIDLTTLTVFAGALGVGIGFGLQRFASNLAGGMTLVFGRVIRRGDIVTVADQLGRIQEVGMRATVLRTLDNIEYVIPNEQFVNEKIINWTYTDPLARIHVPVGVSYASDPEQVRQILLEVARNHSQVRSRPAPGVWFRGFGDSALDFELLVWMDVKRVSQGQLISDLNFGIFRALKEAGIEIPFPQRDLHLRSGWDKLEPPPGEEEEEGEPGEVEAPEEPAAEPTPTPTPSEAEDTGAENPFEVRKRSAEEESRSGDPESGAGLESDEDPES